MLGNPKAPVTVTEFLDLQCPICAEASKTDAADAGQRLRPHRQGEAAGAHAALHRRRLVARRAGRPPAPQAQGKLWPFVEAFYAAQGQENSGYVTDAFLRSVATAAGVDAGQGAGSPTRPPTRRDDAGRRRGATRSASTRPRPSRSRKNGKTTVIGSGVLERGPRSRRRSGDERAAVGRWSRSPASASPTYLTDRALRRRRARVRDRPRLRHRAEVALRGAGGRARRAARAARLRRASSPRSPATASASARWRRSSSLAGFGFSAWLTYVEVASSTRSASGASARRSA